MSTRVWRFPMGRARFGVPLAVVAVALVGAVGSAERAEAAVSFAGASNHPAPTFPGVLADADFNRDGNPDLATAGRDSVSVLLGNGSGGFAIRTSVAAMFEPRSAASADFNGDGNPDLAVANYSTREVVLVLGNGSGGFAPGTRHQVGMRPLSVTSADFNGDGKPDLATANPQENSVSVLLGNGSGGFAAATSYAAWTFPHAVVSADFNGDGNPDLATANTGSNTVSVLLGSGSGGFARATSHAVGRTPRAIVSADFDGDGKPDLATANYDGQDVSVLRGDGSGGFATRTNHAGGWTAVSITSADFDGDGNPDLATANLDSNDVSVLLGNGSGGFAAATRHPAGRGPHAVLSADFNGDGRPDLATGNPASNGVSVLLNSTTDSTAPSTTDDVPAGYQTSDVAVTLSASDTGGSGLDKTHYTTDGTTPTTASAVYDPQAKPTLGDGESISYFSTDLAGNAEAVKRSTAAQVDKAAPTTTDDVPTTPQSSDVSVTLSASDTGGSGLDKTHYTTDGTTPTSASAVYDPQSKPTLSDGESISYFSTDRAGNAEAVKRSPAAQVTAPAPSTGGGDTDTPPAAPLDTPPAAPFARIVDGAPAHRRGRRIHTGITFNCPPGLDASCAGGVRAYASVYSRLISKRRKIQVARSGVNARSGDSKRIVLRLTKRGREIARQRNRLTLRIHIISRGDDGQRVTTTKRLTLELR